MSSSVQSLDIARAQARVTQIRAMLAMSDKGTILGTVSNLVIIIGNDPVLSGLCAYNEFTSAAVLLKPPPAMSDDASDVPGPYPRAWSAADITFVQFYVQRSYTQQAKAGDVEAAMHAVAASNRFHPPRDWLNSLVWDKQPRLDKWLVESFGAPDDAYHSAVGAAFLIASVRRVRRPGCKFDHMPVLEGAQGMGKSTAVKAVFGEQWFTDSLPAELESRDAALGLQGIWVVEFAEIEQIIRAEVEVIKAFLSRSTDRFRAPYGKGFLEYPRQCVLIGTTNERDYLRDATGNRRFWPVRCTKAEVEWIIKNREQLWAEAAAREADGEEHWLTETVVINDAGRTQAERMQEDAWDEPIMHGISGLPWTTSRQVMSEFLSIPTERQDRRAQMRVAAILKKAGWETFIEWDKDENKTSRKWRKKSQ